MRTYRASRGPFREAVHYSDDEVERLAIDELSKVLLLPAQPEPIRIDRFVEKRFGITVETADLKDGVLGFSEFGPRGVQAIYVSRVLDEDRSIAGQRRLRSTIAHEAGHCLLHAHMFVLGETAPLFADASNPQAPKVLCRDIGPTAAAPRSYNGEWWEFQANMAMGHLLMPTPLVQKATQPYLETVGNLGATILAQENIERAARELAEIFDVNPALARIRLEKLYRVARSGQLML